MKNKKRRLILQQFIAKSNEITDDIVQLMMQLYSTSATDLENKETSNYRMLFEQSNVTVTKKT